MSLKPWPFALIALSLCLACGQGTSPSPPPDPRETTVSVAVEGQGGSVRVDGGGVAARGEGGSATVGAEGVDARGEGGSVRVDGGGVDARGEGGSATVGAEGVDARGQGGSATVEDGEVDVRGPGGSVAVGEETVHAQGDGASVSVGHGGVDIDVPGAGVQVGGGGVDLSGVPGMGSVDVHANVDVGAYLEGLEPVEVPGITVPGVEVRQGRGRTIYFVSGDVLFDFDKSDLRPDARAALDQVARSLEDRHPGSRVLVEGYTDAKGSDEYNRKLSLRRAESVKRWLTGAGRMTASEVEVKGRGEDNPVAPNTRPDGSDDAAGRQKNRRVEISVPD